MEKKVLIIKDMHCPNCAMTLESIEDRLPGIKNISASYKRGELGIEYDPGIVSLEEILSEIERLGYHVEM